MRVGSIKSGRTLVATTVLALIAAACGGSASHHGARSDGGACSNGGACDCRGGCHDRSVDRPERRVGRTPVAVCELAYVTGEFAPYGPALRADVVFPVQEVINLDPPLGRPWVNYKEDLGTVGEAQAAKTCLEKDKAEILVSIAHGYRHYRDYMMQYWQENDSPLGPSIHGGLIPGNLGGKAAEPIFRAQGLDEALGVVRGSCTRNRSAPRRS